MMSQTKLKQTQKNIVENFSKSLDELVRKKNFKILQNEISENGDSNFGKKFVFEKMALSHDIFKPVGKNFRVLFVKVVSYVFQSVYSKAKELEQTFDNITKIINITYPVIKTKQKIFSDFRKILIQKFGENSKVHRNSKKNLSITFDEYKTVEKQSKEKVVEANTEKKKFNREQVLQIIQEIKNSTDYIDAIILVCITTGSRLIEVLRISDYNEVVGNPNRVMISGLAKGSGKSRETNLNKDVERPILVITYKELNDAVQLIRKNVREQTDKLGLNNQELSKKYNEIVNRRVKKLKLASTSYDLRKIYANLSYELIADQSKITKNRWIQLILGHESLETSLHYNNVSLTSGESVCPPDPEGIDSQLDEITAKQDNIVKRVEDVKQTLFEQTLFEYPSSKDPNAVRFINKNGNDVYISKLPRLKDGNTLVRGRLKITELEKFGIPITNSNLRKLGIGADNADILIKEHKNN